MVIVLYKNIVKNKAVEYTVGEVLIKIWLESEGVIRQTSVCTK